MANPVKAAELFDVEMDHLAPSFALVADDRCRRFEALSLFSPSRRSTRLTVAGHRPPGRSACRSSAGGNPLEARRRGWPPQGMRPRTEVEQTAGALVLIALELFAHGPRADADRVRDGVRRLLAPSQAHDPLSTMPCQTRILVDVHPVSPGR